MTPRSEVSALPVRGFSHRSLEYILWHEGRPDLWQDSDRSLWNPSAHACMRPPPSHILPTTTFSFRWVPFVCFQRDIVWGIFWPVLYLNGWWYKEDLVTIGKYSCWWSVEPRAIYTLDWLPGYPRLSSAKLQCARDILGMYGRHAFPWTPGVHSSLSRTSVHHMPKQSILPFTSASTEKARTGIWSRRMSYCWQCWSQCADHHVEGCKEPLWSPSIMNDPYKGPVIPVLESWMLRLSPENSSIN